MMRYFTQENWEMYQDARKTRATERGFVKKLAYEAGRLTLQDAGIEILPSCPSTDLLISRRPWIKNFTGVVIRPEDAIDRYSSYPDAQIERIKEIPFVNNLDALMDDPLSDAKNLLNALFGEAKDGGN